MQTTPLCFEGDINSWAIREEEGAEVFLGLEILGKEVKLNRQLVEKLIAHCAIGLDAMFDDSKSQVFQEKILPILDPFEEDSPYFKPESDV